MVKKTEGLKTKIYSSGIMHTERSRADPNRRYFFECLGFVNPEHLRRGLFVGVPCELESTLTISAPVPIAPEEVIGLKKIIGDCGSPEMRVLFEEGSFNASFRYLKACGVFETPYMVHTVRTLQ
ncbi:hypothetical protein HYU13_01355 [Candidatus Woesearchaeota archaeon]|nr:hypothetical protein [Candidatus Woesearchaeota archaeon]